MADDGLDELYAVPPKEFTAARTRLATAARRRGDTEAATRISAARKPTAAAWIVNRLALGDKSVTQRLAEVGDRLRAAHAALDGAQIRALSAEQHRLIDELARAAFDAADVREPSSTMRDDVTGTLQAAVADPGVRQRLGRLARPEQWSGFGSFGDAAPVAARGATKQPAKQPARAVKQTAKKPDRAALRRDKLAAAVKAAERAKADADNVTAEQREQRDAARQRRDDAFTALRKAERALDSAEARYGKAERASRAAADQVKEARAQLKRA
jgi:hypothetical protein